MGLLLFWAFEQSGIATPPAAGFAPVITPAGGFGIDGDLFARQPTAATGDWVVVTNQPGSGQGVLAPDGTPLDVKTTFHIVDPFNDKDNDLIFSQGSKWQANPTNDWHWTTGKPSAKTDLNNLLLHVASDSEGHTWLMMAADRLSVQGNSYIDFELLQNQIVRTNDGNFFSYGPDGGRTVNDLVLSLGFVGGGKVADFSAWRWEADGTGGYHYADVTPSLPAGRVFVALNTNQLTVPYPVFGANVYVTNAFVEAAIDLTAMIEGAQPCEPFGFVAILVKTKASSSDSAGLEDFLEPIAFNFRIGPLADAGPDQALCSEAGGTPFALDGSFEAGLAPVVSNHWSVVSGSATLDDPNSLTATATVTSPVATLRLDVVQLNGCIDSDEVTLTAVPRPVVPLSGPTNTCPGTRVEFSTATPMENYWWSISGNGSIVGDTNLNAVTVLPGEACGESFTVTLVSSSNICTVVESLEVLVQDDTPPVLIAGTNRFVECGFAWDFDPVSAFDDCLGTNVPVEIVSTTTNWLVGETYSATRTWQAMDACSNITQAAQTVTIVDTTPPQIICPSNLVLECAGPDGTEALFAATGFDTCDTNVDVVCTPPSGTQFPLGITVVTCVATDDSGNTNQCSFLVTVQDTTPPTIACPADITQDTDPGLCEAVVSIRPATATDVCGGIVVVGVRSDALALGAPYPKGITWITWTATDDVGLTNSCIQAVTVVDNEPPAIVCAADVTQGTDPGVCEAVVEPSWPEATDNCPGVTVDGLRSDGLALTNPYPKGVTLIHWTATDAEGLTNDCIQTITVVDTEPPGIVCPGDVSQGTDPGLCEAVVDPGVATATDNCIEVTVAGVRSDGLALTNPYPKGETWITWTATDAEGLTNSCTQTITVIDTEPPSIECPPNLLVAELPQDSGSAVVAFESPFASDNCSPTPEVVCTPPSGSTFPVGETTVTCVATDGAGNTNSCDFTVRVVPYRVTVVEVTDSGPGGLRDALLTANALPGETRIEFNIPGSGPHVIRPETNLPTITGPVIIDGASQPGFSGSPIIELDGTLSGGAFDGLVFESGSNSVLNLAVYGFDTGMVFGTNTGGSVIRGCYLGVDGSGTNAVGNTGAGLCIGSANNVIGGGYPGEANLISGNAGNGICFFSEQAQNNRVLGNFIGVGLDGISALPNGGAGIFFENGPANNRIGSTAPSEANIIGFNGEAGIALQSDAGAGNTFGINVVAANGALGIDLGNDGVTVNDPDDSDGGPNDGQNAPELSDARSVDGITTVDGSLTSRSNLVYRLDFYLNDEADPTGYGEGQTFMGFALVPVGTSGTATFTVSFPVAAVFTQSVTATATDPAGNTSEFSQARPVRTPPVSQRDPSSTNAVPGSTVTLCAEASGTLPIFYQWRLNGANIPGETNQCITLTDIEAQNAGSYTVIVYNDLGGFGTEPAALLVPVTNSVPAHDNFVDRQPLVGLSGLTKWSNVGATREFGEPLHAGKPGGSSIWYSWKLPPSGAQRGIVTMGTRGSDFDTLLGVYEGDRVTNLTKIVANEDGGGYFTSGFQFNAIKGHEYAIAIDGYFGESGSAVLSWSFEETPHLLPRIVEEPEDTTVTLGGTAEFFADASVVCGNGVTNCPDPSEYPGGAVPGLALQWYFEGFPMAGATNKSLIISNVQPADLGGYWIQATAKYDSDGVDRTVRSDTAELQINSTGVGGFENVQAKDKFQDTLLSPPWVIGGEVPAGAPPSGTVAAASGLTTGYTGTQIFNTVGSSSSSGETVFCNGVPGGASEWLSLVSEVDGLLVVDTIGSSYATIVALYTVAASSLADFVACSTTANETPLEVPVHADEPFTILVDGQYGASGILVLNYSLIGDGFLDVQSLPGGGIVVQVVGYPGMVFDIEWSTNLVDWATLVSTNSDLEVFNYTDSASPPSPTKYYRARFYP